VDFHNKELNGKWTEPIQIIININIAIDKNKAKLRKVIYSFDFSIFSSPLLQRNLQIGPCILIDNEANYYYRLWT